MRADVPATCAPLAPRGGGTPIANKKSTSTHYETVVKNNDNQPNESEFKSDNLPNACKTEDDKRSDNLFKDDNSNASFNTINTKKKNNLVDNKETYFNKTSQLSYVKIDTSDISQFHESLPYAQSNNGLRDVQTSPNHNNSCETTIFLSQSVSNATIIKTDDTNCNNDRVSDDYTILLSNNSTSDSERTSDNSALKSNNNYDIDTKHYENPSTSIPISNRDIESRSSCESIQDIESDNLHEDCEKNLESSNCITRFGSTDKHYINTKQQNQLQTIESFNNRLPVVEACELSWSFRKHAKRKESKLHSTKAETQRNSLRGTLISNASNQVNSEESENENSYSSPDNGNHNNYNSRYAAAHSVESDPSQYGYYKTKNGKLTSNSNTKQSLLSTKTNHYKTNHLQNSKGCDYKTHRGINKNIQCSSNSTKYNVDEIISVDVVSNRIITVSELLDSDATNIQTNNKNNLLSHETHKASTNTNNNYRGIPKSQSCLEYASVVQRRNNNQRDTERPKSLAGRRVAVRHRDAEEALSSLLWQPYECREEMGEWGDTANEAGSAGAGALTHSLLGVRYGETCAAVMRLTVPAPALCRAAQPATGVEPKQVTINGEPKQGENSALSNNDSGAIASVNVENETISVISGANHNNRVSVNGEVLGCDIISGDIVRDVEVQHHAPRRSWTSCGAQTEEAMVGGPPPLAPPPYSTLPPPHQHHPLPIPMPLQTHAYPFQPVSLRRCQYGEDSESPKTCCGAIGTRTVGLKWFIVLVALAGICCVLVGTVLGAVRAQGRAHLTVLLLMIGVGLVLVTVSGVAWRAISRRRSRNAASRAASSPTGTTRRGAGGASCMRAHHPYAAMLYPEFHCRPPPPSYQASMHEYRLRLLLLDRAASPPPMACPPPAYRPRPRGMPGGPAPYMGRGARGRRRPETRTTTTPLSAVVIQNIALEPYDDIKYDDVQEMEPPIVSDSKEEEVQDNKEGNLVTIVQTGEDTSPVIVTVSGSMPEERTNQTTTSEIDILAHL